MDRTNVLGVQNYQKIDDGACLLQCQKENWSACLVNPLPFHTAPMTDYNRSFPNNKNVGLHFSKRVSSNFGWRFFYSVGYDAISNVIDARREV